MNAIVSLCHFCEVHGPSIMFCTQAFHSSDPQQILDERSTDELENSGTYYFTPPNPLTPSTPLTPGAGAFAAPSTPSANPNPKTSDNCEACRSIPTGQTGFISNDHDAKVSYVSSQYPHHPQVFSMVRQACVRSLSCEVCPGREGPIFFGDEHRGHVLCHTFFIKDSQARGFQRWYSVIVAMMDKIYLLNSWPFLVQHLRTIIDSLQVKASKVYDNEQAKCPQRAHRLTMNMTPTNFLHHRGGNKAARSLVDLTNDKAVFNYLHQAFTWILKAGGQRLTERILEAPPTEDSIIDFEKQEETEEGFVKLFSKKDDMVEEQEEGAVKEEEEDQEAVDEHYCCPVFQTLRHVIKVLGYQRFHELAHHVVMGNQIIIRGQPRKLVRSLIDCLKKLLPKGCCRVIDYSKEYEDSWKCNFLGLPPGTVLPAHATMYVVLDIIEPEEAATQTNFSNYMVCLETPMQMPEKAPTVLNKMERALMNDRLGDSVVEQCLICLKEEWMNKVKVLFKFTKAGGNRSDDDTRRLLQVVKAQDEDKAVLKFWMTGLSVQYRNHMLSSAVQQYV